jgi:hypothetical protein
MIRLRNYGGAPHFTGSLKIIAIEQCADHTSVAGLMKVSRHNRRYLDTIFVARAGTLLPRLRAPVE